MSQDEYHTGKLKKFKGDHEAKAIELLIELAEWTHDGIQAQIPRAYDSAVHLYQDEVYKGKFIAINGELYELIDHVEEDECYGFMNFNENEDGTFSFSTLFYNGETCLTEMLGEEIAKLNKKQGK